MIKVECILLGDVSLDAGQCVEIQARQVDGQWVCYPLDCVCDWASLKQDAHAIEHNCECQDSGMKLGIHQFDVMVHDSTVPEENKMRIYWVRLADGADPENEAK